MLVLMLIIEYAVVVPLYFRSSSDDAVICLVYVYVSP
jgi:hypothetical protein